MAKILIINAGSSSLKWQLFKAPAEHVLAKGEVERLNQPHSVVTLKYNSEKKVETVGRLDGKAAVKTVLQQLLAAKIIRSLDEISGVGHRVVAGGQTFKQAIEVTPEALATIKAMSDFAPLHNPAEAQYIEILQQILPQVRQFAVFDSQFFTQLPEMNAIYSLPYPLTQKYSIRRYGEHGISHQYLSAHAAQLVGQSLADLKMITLHLGSGSSVAAEKDGQAFDTSMGFTPLTGLTMGTRAGDVDPALVPFLMKKEQLSADGVIGLLNQQSGLQGISELSSDMRDLVAAAPTNPQAQLALDIYINRIVKTVGSFAAEMHGLDVLVIAGGIGENNPWLVEKIGQELGVFGIEMVPEKQIERGKEALVSTPSSKVRVYLIPTNEELAMMRQVAALL